MKKITGNQDLRSIFNSINRDLYGHKIVSSFDIVYPSDEYQGVDLTVQGGNYFDTATSANVFVPTANLTLIADSNNYIYVDKTTNTIMVDVNLGSIQGDATKYILFNVVLNEFEEISNIEDFRAWLRF